MDAIHKEVQRVLEKAPGIGTHKAAASANGKSKSSGTASRKVLSSSSSNESVVDALDSLLSSLEEARHSTLPGSILSAQLEQKVTKCSKTIQDKHKEYYNALSKLGRALDKKFTIPLDDVADARLFQTREAQNALTGVVRDHFERCGDWEVARTFEKEAGILSPSQLPLGIFQQLQTITTALEDGNLAPAIKWATQEREYLYERHSQLEFYLHRSRFIRIALGQEHWSPLGRRDALSSDGHDGAESDEDEKFVEAQEHHFEMPSDPDGENVEMAPISAREAAQQTQALLNADGEDLGAAGMTSVEAALHYGRRHLQPQQPAQLDEVKRLFTFLLFLPEVPQAFSLAQLSARIPASYQYFLNADEMHAGALVPLFRRDFSAKQGIARQAPLHVAVEVGAGGALNLIIRVRTLMRAKGNEWSQADELPVEIPLPPHLRFHSTFACPVSKEQGTDENPPMMMACGHVVCNESLMRLSKSTGRVKCPYCPTESIAAQAMRVYF